VIRFPPMFLEFSKSHRLVPWSLHEAKCRTRPSLSAKPTCSPFKLWRSSTSASTVGSHSAGTAMDGAPVEITAGEISQAEAARKWRVDVSTVIGIRRTVKDAAQLRWPASPGARAASSRPPRPVERIGATTNSSDGRQFPAFSA